MIECLVMIDVELQQLPTEMAPGHGIFIYLWQVLELYTWYWQRPTPKLPRSLGF